MPKILKTISDAELAAYNHGYCFQKLHDEAQTIHHAKYFYSKKPKLEQMFLSGAMVAREMKQINN